MTVSPDLVVDLATEPAPSGLKYLRSLHRHLLFTESDESIVVINVCNMTATRYRSPRFKEVIVVDIINGRGMPYNMETNRFSQKFAIRRLLHTATPSRWYYLESDMTKPVIMIKDLTDEVDRGMAGSPHDT